MNIANFTKSRVDLRFFFFTDSHSIPQGTRRTGLNPLGRYFTLYGPPSTRRYGVSLYPVINKLVANIPAPLRPCAHRELWAQDKSCSKWRSPFSLTSLHRLAFETSFSSLPRHHRGGRGVVSSPVKPLSKGVRKMANLFYFADRHVTSRKG